MWGWKGSYRKLSPTSVLAMGKLRPKLVLTHPGSRRRES